jgi:hypothetical protein
MYNPISYLSGRRNGRVVEGCALEIQVNSLIAGKGEDTELFLRMREVYGIAHIQGAL